MDKIQYKQKKRKIRHLTKTAGILLFAAALLAGGILGLLLWLRPSVSQRENRTLAAFPQFSVDAVLDGSYFAGISEWYSDSFPLRDVWMEGNDRMQRLSGIRTVQIIQASGQADKIPDPVRPAAAENSGGDTGDDGGRQPDLGTQPSEDATENDRTVDAASENGQTEGESEDDRTEDALAADAEGEQETGGLQSDESTAGLQSDESTAGVQPEPVIGQTVNGLFTIGDTGLGLYYFNRESADRYIETVNRAAASLAGQTQVYDMLVPISSSFYMDQVTHDNLGSSSEKDATAYYYGSMSDQVRTVPIYEMLAAHADEYIYFRTDHHWNGPGAYYAYRTFAETKGITPHEQEEYQVFQFPGFLGSYYNTCKSVQMEQNPDIVIAYQPLTCSRMTYTATDGTEHECDIICDVSAYAANGKYLCFAAGDNPFNVIHNPNVTNGETCLVIKESYGNSVIPLLADHYQTLYWIDYRYYQGSITDFARQNQVNDLIFINSLGVISSGDMTGRLSSLIQ